MAQRWPQPHPCRTLSWVGLSFPSSWGRLRPPQDILSRAQALVNKQHCQQTGPQQAEGRCQDPAECAISPTGANSGKGDCRNPPLLASHKSLPLKKNKNLKALSCVRNASPRAHIGGLEKRLNSSPLFSGSFSLVFPSCGFLESEDRPHQDTATGPLLLSPPPCAFWRRLSICHWTECGPCLHRSKVRSAASLRDLTGKMGLQGRFQV